jgi:Tfp pilus assembly protein PilX
MKTSLNSVGKKGFIIVISLTLMLVMITMGVGLYFSAKQSSNLIGDALTKSDSFNSAETCIAQARLWLVTTAATGAPCINVAVGAMCYNVPAAQMTTWNVAGESTISRNRSQAQRYECSIALLGRVAYEGGEGVGFDVGEGSGYGKAATNNKYLYRIRSSGSLNAGTVGAGAGSFLSRVEVIDSMIF